MKITKIETIRSPDRAYCWILLHMDNGHVGIGETYHHADPAEQVVHEFARELVLGRNPEDIESLWDLSRILPWSDGYRVARHERH